MIVGTYFDGDNDDALKWQQHVRYRDAVGIIAHAWREYFKNAAIMLGQDAVALPERFDHRTLQAAHDYLAAWWRWKHDRRDPYFEGMEPVTVDDWLLWLGHEVKAWPIQAPHTIQLVVGVLLSQNTDVGYAAEDALQDELRCCYTGMPESSKNIGSTNDATEDGAINYTMPTANKGTRPKTRNTCESSGEKYSKVRALMRNSLRTYPMLTNSLMLVLALAGIIFLATMLNHIFAAAGWQEYYDHSEEESVAGFTSYAIIAASSLTMLNVYLALMWFVDPDNERETNKILSKQSAPYLIEARPWLLSVPIIISYAILSAFIDIITSNYLYRENSNFFLHMGLMGIYLGSAFFIFCLWARIARFGPFAK